MVAEIGGGGMMMGFMRRGETSGFMKRNVEGSRKIIMRATVYSGRLYVILLKYCSIRSYCQKKVYLEIHRLKSRYGLFQDLLIR